MRRTLIGRVGCPETRDSRGHPDGFGSPIINTSRKAEMRMDASSASTVLGLLEA